MTDLISQEEWLARLRAMPADEFNRLEHALAAISAFLDRTDQEDK